MIPDFERGVLPPGIHEATWEGVVDRFGWTDWRKELLEGLKRALDDLRTVGCRQVWLDGSFVTDKDVPGDFDMCWDMEGVDLEAVPPALLDLDPPRALQKATYRGDILPNVIERNSESPFIEFFQEDAETGQRRGIVRIDLRNDG